MCLTHSHVQILYYGSKHLDVEDYREKKKLKRLQLKAKQEIQKEESRKRRVQLKAKKELDKLEENQKKEKKINKKKISN